MVGELLSLARARLAPLLGRDDAVLETEVMLGAASGRSRAWLRAFDDGVIPTDVLALFERSLQRRLAGEPLAYVLGTQEFWSQSLRVTPAVLIPRADTEILVEQALRIGRCRSPMDEQYSALSVLELGTGSGAIACALALESPQWKLIATDLSSDALKVAAGNIQELGLQDRISLVQGSWFAALKQPVQFDLIVSNPPYIAADDPHLQALGFEPVDALSSGADGLDAIREIVAGASDYLRPGGWLLLEHGYDQGVAVRDLLNHHEFTSAETFRDLGSNDRVSLAQKLA